MTAGRTDTLIAVGGAALGAVGAALWGDVAQAPAAVLLGASLGLARPYPPLAWASAAAILLITAALGEVPGGDTFVVIPLVVAHAVFAGWSDDRWHAGLIALLAASVVSTELATEDSFILDLVLVPASWLAGRALREREQLAAELAARAGELEEERVAYAELSVRYERARIASELHDIVGHALSVMVVQASAGQRLAAQDPGATAETFEAIAEAAQQAERDMGRLVALLGDEGAIGRAPDLALVEELVARATGSGLDVTLRLEGEREGPPAALSEASYRVAQEGITNALRYAGGAAVSVRVRGNPDVLVVEVENGAAADAAALPGVGTGTGLQGLRERVGACGGSVAAGPTPEGGWLLRASMPRRVEAPSR